MNNNLIIVRIFFSFFRVCSLSSYREGFVEAVVGPWSDTFFHRFLWDSLPFVCQFPNEHSEKVLVGFWILFPWCQINAVHFAVNSYFWIMNALCNMTFESPLLTVYVLILKKLMLSRSVLLFILEMSLVISLNARKSSETIYFTS